MSILHVKLRHQEARRERKKWISEVAELFSRICHDNDGRLTKEDFVYHLNNSDRIATCFHKLGTLSKKNPKRVDIHKLGCIKHSNLL